VQTQYQPIFQSLRLSSGLQLKNRIVMAPMTNFSSNADGTVSDAEVAYYERRSSGVGMVVTACTYVTPNGKGFQGEFAADSDEMIPSLRRLASAIQAKGAKAVLQIFHGGRACAPDLVPNGDIVSASHVAAEGSIAPRPLENEEIRAIVIAFGETTRRAIEAGFDGVEIHGANGYLIQQFFSPYTNLRTDEWGGSLEKRMTFPLAIVNEVKRVITQYAKQPFLVGYRFSPEEPEDNGITMADTLELVDILASQGLDYLHVSIMDFWSKPRRGVEATGSRIDLIQERAGNRTIVIGVGSLHTADDVVKALQTGVALIALGREIIMDPDWVQKVAAGRETEIQTTLTKDDQARLVVPDSLWQAIMNAPGWFPVVQNV